MTDIPASIEARARNLKTIGYFAMFVSLGLSIAVLGPTLPGLAEQTNTQLNQISILFTAHSLGYMLGALLSGRLFDRLPGHWLLVVMLVSIAVVLSLVPVTPSLWLLALAIFISGIGGGGLDVGGNLMLVWVHRGKVGPYMNGLHFFFGLGAFLTPIIMAQAVLVTGSFKWGYWAIASMMLPAALWLLRLPSPSIIARQEDSTKVRSDRLVLLLLMAFFFLYVGGESSFGGWIFTYASALELTSETSAAYLTSVFWGALMVGRLVSVPLAVRFRSSYLLGVDLIGCLLSIMLILLLPKSSAALWVGTIGVGFWMASLFPLMMTLAENRLGLSGQITGWFLVASSLGGMTIPWLIGQLFVDISPRATMMVILIVMSLALGVFGLINVAHK
jgi:fucose permease